MTIFDQIVLLLTGLVLIYMIRYFFNKQKSEETAGAHNLFYLVSFLVFLVAGLILIFAGWGALGNNFVAVVAGLIPFSLATGLVTKYHEANSKNYLYLMVLGLVLITVSRYGGMSWSSIVYPLFHAIAGLTIFFVPILAVKAGKAASQFVYVTVGGTLISLGGIALAFLKADKQLLFFSWDFVLLILAPLLFLTALFFSLGFLKEEN